MVLMAVMIAAEIGHWRRAGPRGSATCAGREKTRGDDKTATSYEAAVGAAPPGWFFRAAVSGLIIAPEGWRPKAGRPRSGIFRFSRTKRSRLRASAFQPVVSKPCKPKVVAMVAAPGNATSR